jgi:hypothetical protein
MMSEIKNFFEIRKDRKTVPEGATVKQKWALGAPSRIIEAHWTNENLQREIAVKSPFGLPTHIVQGRKSLAVLVYQNHSDNELVILNTDGTDRLKIPNILNFDGESKRGKFAWFEPAHEPADGVFGAIFRSEESAGAQYWLDIDAADGKVLLSTLAK